MRGFSSLFALKTFENSYFIFIVLHNVFNNSYIPITIVKRTHHKKKKKMDIAPFRLDGIITKIHIDTSLRIITTSFIYTSLHILTTNFIDTSFHTINTNFFFCPSLAHLHFQNAL